MILYASDLMRSASIVGSEARMQPRVNDLAIAIENVERGETFFWDSPRGLFHVAMFFYSPEKFPREQIIARLRETATPLPRQRRASRRTRALR